MTEIIILAPISGCNRKFQLKPVVALRLPPATFSNRSAVNRNGFVEIWNEATSAFHNQSLSSFHGEPSFNQRRVAFKTRRHHAGNFAHVVVASNLHT